MNSNIIFYLLFFLIIFFNYKNPKKKKKKNHQISTDLTEQTCPLNPAFLILATGQFFKKLPKYNRVTLSAKTFSLISFILTLLTNI